MAGKIARGLNDVQIYKLESDETFATVPVDVPGARTFGYSTSADSDPWHGDDTVIATTANAPTGSGSIASGALSLAALAIVLGGSVVASGVTPNVVNTYAQPGTAGTRYFGAVGQSNAADGGAYRVTIHMAIATEVSEELANQSWNEPQVSIEFIPNAAGKFITRAQFETAVAIYTPE